AGSPRFRAVRECPGAVAAARRRPPGLDLYRHRPALPGPARVRRDRLRPHPEQRAPHPQHRAWRPLQPLLLHVRHPHPDRVSDDMSFKSYRIHEMPPQLPAAAMADLQKVEVATIGHYLHDRFMAPALKAVIDGRRIAGTAVTLSIPGP